MTKECEIQLKPSTSLYMKLFISCPPNSGMWLLHLYFLAGFQVIAPSGAHKPVNTKLWKMGFVHRTPWQYIVGVEF